MTEGIFRFKIGDLECIALQDGDDFLPATQILEGNPDNTIDQAIADGLIEAEDNEMSFTCLIVNTPTECILIDTGMGEVRDGKIHAHLKALNITPDDFDKVILSHAHTDHFGGLVDEETGTLLFPNSRHLIFQEEWDYWMSDDIAQDEPERRTFLEQALMPIQSKLEFFEMSNEFVNGITAIPAQGHTFGHTAFLIESQEDTLLYTGDAFLHPIFIHNFYLQFKIDRQPEQAQQTRRNLCKLAVEKGAMVLSYHFAFPSMGKIEASGDGYIWKWLNHA